MPPAYVRTIREELLYEYAKLISRSAFNGEINYKFVTNRFNALREGKITISGTNREWEKEATLPRECVFCGAALNLQKDHLIPVSRGGQNVAENMVWSCRNCNLARGNKGIFEWLGLKKKDKLHRLVAGKYLKELFDLHEKQGTLDICRNDLSVKLCPNCHTMHACVEWKTEGKLTCFCLESIF